jgi:hypothetical protein
VIEAGEGVGLQGAFEASQVLARMLAGRPAEKRNTAIEGSTPPRGRVSSA